MLEKNADFLSLSWKITILYWTSNCFQNFSMLTFGSTKIYFFGLVLFKIFFFWSWNSQFVFFPHVRVWHKQWVAQKTGNFHFNVRPCLCNVYAREDFASRKFLFFMKEKNHAFLLILKEIEILIIKKINKYFLLRKICRIKQSNCDYTKKKKNRTNSLYHEILSSHKRTLKVSIIYDRLEEHCLQLSFVKC